MERNKHYNLNSMKTKNKFGNSYKFCDGGLDRFILQLQMELILTKKWTSALNLIKLCYQIKIVSVFL